MFTICTEHVNQQKTSNFGLIEETLDQSGILLAETSLTLKWQKFKVGYLPISYILLM